MLVHYLRRCAGIETTLSQNPVFAGFILQNSLFFHLLQM